MAKSRRGGKRKGQTPSPGRSGGSGGQSPLRPELRGDLRDHWRADGVPKARFPTQDEANRSSLRLRLEQGADLDPYLCSFCNGWHLGSRRS
jgi:hypothetical protein